MKRSFYKRCGKRAFDCVTAVLILVVLSPMMAALALMVRWRLGSPVFFGQLRPGQDSVPFWMYKFRTMSDARDSCGRLLPDEQRLTRFGRFLRAASLDELPELWNVIRGEMSLVGPRPLLTDYLPLYTPEQSRRHAVLPGITGWAQVNGRNKLSWAEKFACDVWYVDHVSLSLDLKILWLTVIRVLRSDGITADGYATMPEFSSPDRSRDAEATAESQQPPASRAA